MCCRDSGAVVLHRVIRGGVKNLCWEEKITRKGFQIALMLIVDRLSQNLDFILLGVFSLDCVKTNLKRKKKAVIGIVHKQQTWPAPLQDSFSGAAMPQPFSALTYYWVKPQSSPIYQNRPMEEQLSQSDWSTAVQPTGWHRCKPFICSDDWALNN